MKTLLIGPNGQLGTDIAKVMPTIPMPREKLDITDKQKVFNVLKRHKPDMVISTAAYHQVDKCEDEQGLTFLTNATASQYLAEACREIKACLVFFSTDYVFGADKSRTKPYTETDQEGPVNVYGTSKLAGEKIIQYILDKYFILRICGLFGKAGSAGKGGNFVETMIRLAKEKGEVRVVNDQVLTPTYTVDIAARLKDILKTKNYGLYHLTSEGQCSWYQFAKKIFELTGLKVKCQPVNSKQFPTRAQRPKFSVLANKKLKTLKFKPMPLWNDALKRYLIEKGHLC